jgi:hypothetical protein
MNGEVADSSFGHSDRSRSNAAHFHLFQNAKLLCAKATCRLSFAPIVDSPIVARRSFTRRLRPSRFNYVVFAPSWRHSARSSEHLNWGKKHCVTIRLQADEPRLQSALMSVV